MAPRSASRPRAVAHRAASLSTPGLARCHTRSKLGLPQFRVAGNGKHVVNKGVQWVQVVQIGCYMTEEEADELSRYAASMELSRPAACALIIQRELRKPRLRRSKAGPVAALPPSQGRRVTVHLRNASLKTAFESHVRSLGLGSDEAAAALFRKELEERWLFKLFGSCENRG